MKQRIISGIVLGIILVPTLLIGGVFLGVVLGAVSLVGIYELLKVFKMEKTVQGFITYAADIAYYIGLIAMGDRLLGENLKTSAFMLFLVFFFIVLMMSYVISFPKCKALETMSCFFSLFYAGVLLGFVYIIRSLESGIYLVWIIFIASWICDTFAYFSGVFFGKHKAFPVLSPKKTWEGCVGGVLASVLVAFVFALIFSDKLELLSFPELALPVTVAVCAIISLFGDLAASAIKRDYKIKDYGNLIPSHGGIMDRFDSVIFVAPVVYYMLILFK